MPQNDHIERRWVYKVAKRFKRRTPEVFCEKVRHETQHAVVPEPLKAQDTACQIPSRRLPDEQF